MVIVLDDAPPDHPHEEEVQHLDTCSSPPAPPPPLTDRGKARLWPPCCPRPRPWVCRATGVTLLLICGRPKCSLECRDKWARRKARALMRGLRALPATHLVCLAPKSPMLDSEYGAVVRRLLQLLKKLTRGEFLYANEWSRGRRHHHVLVRTTVPIDTPYLRRLEAKACPGVRLSISCRPVERQAAAARYLFKDLGAPDKKELAPKDFAGKLYRSTKRFLPKTLDELWREQVDEWYADGKRPAPAPGTASTGTPP